MDSHQKEQTNGAPSPSIAHAYNVLFLCTGNSARSILAESLLNQLGDGRFRGFSAGSAPLGSVHPQTLALLRKLDMPTLGLRSKSWDEFAKPGAPMLDFVFTVCDRAGREACPICPGRPVTVDWSIPDPASVTGSGQEQAAAFFHAYHALRQKIALLMALPVASLDRNGLQRHFGHLGGI